MSEPGPDAIQDLLKEATAVRDADRLKALRHVALLDTPAEESFDRLTRLAARLLEVPIALVSLVDEDRQFFKSHCGLPEPWASRRETPLSHSFCQHAVELGRPLVIDDAREHPLVRDNLAITDLNVIAYLGIPLVTPDGHVLGSFCAIDTEPRRWTDDEVATLADLARAVSTEIELRLEIRARSSVEEERARLLEWLNHERSRLLNVFMEAPAAIAVLRGPQHNVEMANPVLLRLIGFRDVVGRPVREAFPDIAGESFVDHLDEVYRTGRPFTGTALPVRWPILEESGRATSFFNFAFQPLFDAEGKTEGLLAHAVEVTEQVLARQQVEALAAERDAILRQIADGVIVTDPDGRITFINEAARNIHGLEQIGVRVEEYAETYHLYTLDGEPYRSEELPLARAVLHGETVVDAEWVIRRVDGTEVIAQGSAAPVHDESGARLGAVLTLRDITAQRGLERQREELLDDRDRAQEQLAAALEARARFSTVISHELRTPINAVLGYNDLVLAGVYGEFNSGQQEALEKSQKAARHLLALVNDILDLSKLEAGKLDLHLEEVRVKALVADTVSTVRPMAEERGSELVVSGDAENTVLRTDSVRAQQVLLNLLSNAIKFGQGKPIQVCSEHRAEGEIAISVRDSGEGIAPGDLERVFEEFVQLGNGRGGTGLGLPISRRIAELLGGRLEVESELGKGSAFRLVLPALRLTESADSAG